MSNKIENQISALLKYYQASPFSSKTLSTSRDCRDFISLIWNIKRGNKVTLNEVNKTKQLPVNAKKIHYRSCQIKTAEDVCNMIYGNDTVTPTRCQYMLNVLNVVDNLTDTNLYDILCNKITLAASEHHKKALFIQPTVENYPICLLPYPVMYCSLVLKMCCGNYLCKGCM